MPLMRAGIILIALLSAASAEEPPKTLDEWRAYARVMLERSVLDTGHGRWMLTTSLGNRVFMLAESRIVSCSPGFVTVGPSSDEVLTLGIPVPVGMDGLEACGFVEGYLNDLTR